MSMNIEKISLQEVINELWSPFKSLSNCKSNDEIDTILTSMYTCSSVSIVIENIIPVTVNLLLKLLGILQSLQSNNSEVPLLSVQHLRIIYSTIEILWHWGISCEVKRRAGFSMPSQSLPNSLLMSKLVIDYITISTTTIPRSAEQLWSVVDCLSQLVLNPNFSGLMLQRNLDRLLLSYLVLERDSSDDVVSLRAASTLRKLYEGPLAGAVVTKLRGFTKGPVWLRDACCGILNSILQSPGGLEAVLSGYLEGSLDSSYAEALQVHVAKLVTTVPAGAEADPFLLNIAEQALDLLLYGLFKNDKTLLRVCALIVTRIAMVSPALCDEKLLGVLSAPLLLCLLPNHQHASDCSNVYKKYLDKHEQSGGAGPVEVVIIQNHAVLADERAIQSCIEMLHVLLTICPTHRALMESIVRVKVDQAVLRLYAYLLTQQTCVNSGSTWNTSASTQLLHTVEEIGLSYFQYRGVKALSALEQLALGNLGAHIESQTPCFQLTRSGMVEVRMSTTVHGLHLGATDCVLNAEQLLQARKLSADEATVSETKVAAALIEKNVRAVVLIINKLEERYSVRLAALKERAERTHSKGKSSSTDSSKKATVEGGYEYLGSELFLRCLHGFLRIPHSPSDAAEDLEVSPVLWGMTMLKLQEGLPFAVLLRDGLQILRLLKAFVEHYAVTPSVADTVPNDGVQGASGSDNGSAAAITVKKRPLIVELQSSVVEISDTSVEFTMQQAGPRPEETDRQGLLECALELLAGILGLGEAERAPEEEKLIRDLVEPLQAIAFRDESEEEALNPESGVSGKARDVALLILSRSYNQTHISSPSSSSGQGGGRMGESFSQLLERMRSVDFLYADSPALRGYAMSILLTHLRTRRTGLPKVQCLCEEDAQLGLSVLLPLLVDQESFVYLSALQVLRELTQHQPRPVFAALVSSFAAEEVEHNVISLSFPVLPQSRRAMVGEALVLALGQARKAKHDRPAYHIQIVQQLPALVNACLKIARQRLSLTGSEAVNQNVDLSKMRLTDKTVTDTQLSATPPQSGISETQAVKLGAAAEAADEVILRQSAVSLLAEAVQMAGATVHCFLDDVLDVTIGVLSMESAYTQSSRAARRSAAYLASVATAELLKGASASHLLQMTSGSNATGRKSRSLDSFQSTYEVLQRVALSDPDTVVAYHAGQGLCTLQEIYEAIYRKALSGADLPDIDIGGEEIVINELEVCLIGILNDSTEKAIGFCQFICTSGEHSITKSINLHDARGVMVGKVPITSFYYQSAIKLGDKVMFKPMYEPTAKEYAFLLSRRIRSPSKSKPVTFDRNIEHQLNNEARDLISRDFTIVSAKNLHKKTGTVSKSNKTANHNDTLTYNPGMTRNGAMSDAVRGRTKKMSATASKARTTKPAAEAPKLRPTYMSVGYVKEKQWPERNTGEAERNLFRLQQASEMKLQILKDIAQLARQRNARTQARQDAIRRKKTHVQIQEGKIKKVLAKKESEIQLLKGTLTHLRLSNALRNDAATPIRTTAATKSPSSEARSFSRLRQLVYPDAPSSILKRSVTPNTSRSGTSASRPATPSLRRPASVPHSGRRGSKVSFSQSQAATPSSLYRPLGKNGPYDSRHKPSSQKYSQARTPQHELVDQLSEAFDLTFEAPSESGALEPPLTEHGVDSSQVIAKDWLANARASINEFHRPVANQNSFIQQHSAVSSTHSQMNPSVGKSDSNGHRIHQIPAVKAQFSSNVTNHTDHSHYQPVTADISSSSSEEDNTVNLRLQQKAEQMPSFLNSLLETRPNGGRELDTTVSSIAVGDIPYFPATVREDSMRQSSGAASPIGSEHSSDSLENLSVPLEPAVPTARWPSRGTEENISHPRRQSWNSTGTGSAMSTTTQTHSNTALKRLERNQQYSAMLLQQQKQEEMQEQQHREEALAKQNYNIRPQPGTSGSYAVRPSSVSKQTIADQLRKNRAYDTPTGTRNTRSVPQEDPKSTATEYRSAECGTEECSGLSNSLEKNITDVTNTVQALQGRVRDLARQSEEDAVPRGWVRRSVSEASGQSNKVSTSSVNLPNPQSNDGAVLVLPAGEEGAERKPMLMAEDDIKLVFEDASSSSGEFDSVSDKHSTVR